MSAFAFAAELNTVNVDGVNVAFCAWIEIAERLPGQKQAPNALREMADRIHRNVVSIEMSYSSKCRCGRDFARGAKRLTGVLGRR